MLSPLTMRLVDFSMKYCCFLKLAPYEWNSKTQLLCVPKSRADYLKWCFVRNLFFLNLGCVYFNTWRVLKTPGETVEEKMYLIFGSAAYSVPSLVQLVMTTDLMKPATVINTSIAYFKKFEELSWKFNAPPLPKTLEYLIAIIIMVAVTQPYFIHMLYLSKPTSKVFVVASLILKNDSENEWYLIVLGMSPSFWLSVIGWGSCILLWGPSSLVVIYVYLFIAGEIRANAPDTYTKAELRRPPNAFMTYRVLQLVIGLVNFLLQDFLLIVVDLLMSLVVVCNFVLIVFYRDLPLAGFAVFGGYSFMSTAALFVVYIKLGRFHESSKIFTRSWKHKVDYGFGEKKMMMKCIKSCRLNRIEMGSVGYFQKPNSIRIIAKIIFYTTKFLMLMRPK